MRLFSLLGIASAVVLAACAGDAPDPVSAITLHPDANKVEVCHVDGSNNFRLISIADPALPTHIAHGDAQPGDPVPGQSGKKFTESCAIVNAGPDFIAFYIRNHNPNGTITPPWDPDMSIVENVAGNGFAAMTPQGGQKVGYGTTAFDGEQVNQLNSVDWTKISGKDGLVAYLNLWVTDGTHYAIIASENDYRGTDFGTRQEWKVFETDFSHLDWLFASGTGGRDGADYLTLNGTRVTLSQLANNIVLMDPGSYPSPIGTGAPRGGYGFNIIFGDTQANFVGSYELANVVVTIGGTAYPAVNP